MCNYVGSAIAILAFLAVTPASGQASGWAVWVDLNQRPHRITVAPPAAMAAPWALEGGIFADKANAWKRACWLTRNGGIYGETFQALEIMSGAVTCDANCNCRV